MHLSCNVLYIAPCVLHEGIGGGARLGDMVRILESLQINVNLISYRPNYEFKISSEKTGEFLNSITIDVPKSSPKFIKALAIPLIISYGIKHIKYADIVIAHSPCIMSGFPAMVLANLFRKPLIIDHMDVRDRDTPKCIFDKVLRSAATIFTISRFLEKEMNEISHRRVTYLPTFTNTNDFRMDSLKREKIRNELNITDSDVIIGYAGSFANTEGIPILLKAFKRISQIHRNVKLIIIGGKNGDELNSVSSLMSELAINEKAILIPPQPHDFIPNYLSACDILCAPKIDCKENRAANPVKVVEYLSMGLPVVCSAVGGIIDMIENGVDGFLVEPENIDDLVDTLEWIILNSDRAKVVGERARRKVIDRYSYDAIRGTIRNSIDAIESIKGNAWK